MFRPFFPRHLLGWLGPLVVAGIAALLIAVAVIVSGVYNLAASTPHPQYLAKILHYTFTRVVQHQSDETPPADIDDISRVAIGAGHYAQVCANCHGTPGLGQNPVMMSMTPRPPYLPRQIKDLSPTEMYFVLQHGVKYSAMPFWPTQQRPDEIWDMVAFLKRLHTMSEAQYRELAFGSAPAAQLPPQPFVGTGVPRRYVSYNWIVPQGDINAHVYPVAGPGMLPQVNAPLANCARCHGAGGTGRVEGGFPNLAIQSPDYIVRELNNFASGRRPSAIMQTAAAQLSPDQMRSLAVYYSSQPDKASKYAQAVRFDPAEIAAGQLVANRASSCNYCHNTKREGKNVFPRLEGQDARYIISQLRLFRAGQRYEPGVYNPMPQVAHNLTDAQIKSVAIYFASLSPVGPQPGALGSRGYIGPTPKP